MESTPTTPSMVVEPSPNERATTERTEAVDMVHNEQQTNEEQERPVPEPVMQILWGNEERRDMSEAVQ